MEYSTLISNRNLAIGFKIDAKKLNIKLTKKQLKKLNTVIKEYDTVSEHLDEQLLNMLQKELPISEDNSTFVETPLGRIERF